MHEYADEERAFRRWLEKGSLGRFQLNVLTALSIVCMGFWGAWPLVIADRLGNWRYGAKPALILLCSILPIHLSVILLTTITGSEVATLAHMIVAVLAFVGTVCGHLLMFVGFNQILSRHLTRAKSRSTLGLATITDGKGEPVSTTSRQSEIDLDRPTVGLGGWGTLANFFNPVMVIGLIFLGPPGWILIWLHAIACEKVRAKALQLANKAEQLRADGREDEALLFLRAIEENVRSEWRPVETSKIKEKTLSQKYKVGNFRPLSQWQQHLQKDGVPEILARSQSAPRLIYAAIKGKGQAFYNGELLEYTLPSTQPLPSELVDLVNHRGFQEYSEKMEQELMSQVRQPYEEVNAVGIIEGRPELVVLKTERNNMVIVERNSFEYLSHRYRKVRAFDDSKPVLFYEASFVHGYLWPVTV